MLLALLGGLAARPPHALAQSTRSWALHDERRPQPPVVDPGAPGRPPSDALVLFDGRDLAQWRTRSGEPAQWQVEHRYLEVVPGSAPPGPGDLVSVSAFGDAQVHVEWATPVPPTGEGQTRGNSGVFLMEQYEVQVLDSYRNRTYPDGQAAAIYGQSPPLVNAARPPGEWQTYDIVFRRPRFDSKGKLRQPARMTVFHNGVLVHDQVELTGPTAHQERLPYRAHPDRLPLVLQYHGYPVRYRNIWVRELPEP